MPSSVVVVTDSTAYLPQEEASRLGIVVVPLQVIVGGKPFDDVVQIGASEMTGALEKWSPVTTSRPAPRRFTEAYDAAAAEGATGVVSIHLSGEMSGTVEAARSGAREASIPVEVIDSRSIAMGLGFPVLAAAEAAAGARPRRGGRRRPAPDGRDPQLLLRGHPGVPAQGRAHRRRGLLVGSALMIKPLLHITEGTISPLEKVRTATRAIARLEELAVQAAGSGPAAVAVQHIAARSRAETLAERLAQRVPALTGITVVEVGAVIGAHVGPGMLGVTVSPAAP
nr:DegV family protein [Planobispora longispora]